MYPTLHRTDSFSSVAAALLADITYRQLDYWSRIGVVRAAAEAKGSGSRRLWSAQGVAVLAVLSYVGAHVQISKLDELAQLLIDLPLSDWPDKLVFVDGDGGVWWPDEDGPPVATAVQLGAVLRLVRARAAAAGMTFA